MKTRVLRVPEAVVPAILNGTKTQLRTLVDVTPELWNIGSFGPGIPFIRTENKNRHCPLGRPGDRLWVAEDWRLIGWNEGAGSVTIEYRSDNPESIEPVLIPEEADPDGAVFCRLWQESSDDAENAGVPTDENGQYHWARGASPCRWRPSITMPRWASRILLEVTDVRLQRIQDITEADAIREGFDSSQSEAAIAIGWYEKPITAFRRFWDHSHSDAMWRENPWVWVVSFKRIGQ